MLLSEMWINKMKDVLESLYGDKINKDALDKELRRIVEAKSFGFPKLTMRNLYTNQNVSVDLDGIENLVHDEGLCILANNALTYSSDKIKTPVPDLLISAKNERNIHKARAKELDSEISKQKTEGTFDENSDLLAKCLLEEAMQLKVKATMNSIYGIMNLVSSVIYNPDTSSAVTSQGRNFISEMLWTIERLLYGTLHFSRFSEYTSYLDYVKRSIHKNSPLLSYITYIPTKEDCIKTMAKQINRITGVDNVIRTVDNALFLYVNSLDDIGRIYFYYKCNLMTLIKKNPKIFNKFDEIISSPTEYVATGSKTPKEFLPILDEICKIIDEFVLPDISTPERVFKYKNKRRRGIIVSDTDSVIINLNPYAENLYKLHCLKHNLPFPTRQIAFIDEELDFKLVNIMSHICVHATEVAGDRIVKNNNVPEHLRKWVEMKNEFLFKRLVMYKGAKKNYICHTRLREGGFKNDVATTGIKLNSSTLNAEVKDKMLDIIENNILRTEIVDPVLILRKTKELENFIISRVRAGDFTFGKKCRFSGMNGYKTGIYQNNAGRSCLIWNLLNPNSKIGTGDYCYIFQTKLYTRESIDAIEYKYPEVYKDIIDKIYNNKAMPELAKYGLKSIAIPISASVTKIPDWLIPHIDYENLTNKHLQPIITILPSVGARTSKIRGNTMTYSPLISF